MIWRWRRRPAAAIRRLCPEDAAIWRDLRLEALLHHPEAYGSSHDDWAGQPLSAFAARLEKGTILGAFADQALIGSTALDPMPTDPRTGELTAVYVKTGHRGQGIARALFRAAEVEAKAQGMTRLSLTVATSNAAAIRFYERAGFRSEGEAPRTLASDGRLLELVRMARVIRA
jgi:ribosomal protein S18 acetylase RimI-like enzyme|tara:strand:- start:639 stop:1157 length:519 start_codon:yes stop_codon:yes gene_type:complete